jgi:hypothetical protein
VAQPVQGYFGPGNVNAFDAKRDPDSLWNFIATLIQRYRECPELGWGRFELIKQPSARVLLHRCTWDSSVVIAAHNFGAEPVSVTASAGSPGEPDSSFAGAVLRDLLGGQDLPLADDGGFEVPLDRYGYRWFRIQRPADRRIP